MLPGEHSIHIKLVDADFSVTPSARACRPKRYVGLDPSPRLPTNERANAVSRNRHCEFEEVDGKRNAGRPCAYRAQYMCMQAGCSPLTYLNGASYSKLPFSLLLLYSILYSDNPARMKESESESETRREEYLHLRIK